MNEILTNKIIEYISKTEVLLNVQLPDFVQQALDYALFQSVFDLSFSIGFIVYMFTIFKITVVKVDDDDFLKYVLYLFLFLSIVLGATCSQYNISKIIKIKTAPKVYLVDKYIKKGC